MVAQRFFYDSLCFYLISYEDLGSWDIFNSKKKKNVEIFKF